MTDGEPPAVDARDSAFMRRALDLAARGWGQTAPNPMVGAVVVRDGVVVGEGYHARYGGDHAEIAALRAAGGLARGATVYVSLEPCAHHGKTPPCADALIAAGVARVVAAADDPNAKAGGGADRLRAAGVDVDVGVEEDAARELNAPFFHAFASADRPWVIVKLALSVDGAIADARRSAGWLTGPEARREAHALRARHDAVWRDPGAVASQWEQAGRVDPRLLESRVRGAFWEALADARATLTHHHAIGADHAPWLTAEDGELGVDVLRAVKDRCDPAGIMNPGKLLPG
jgi:diaminohydroxyphosphoribosylaminopyrimidine deaminase/5-amino-6-(5-phosphoribosylamino)uracil reductase